jgi:opacity protein-like surface antigen
MKIHAIRFLAALAVLAIALPAAAQPGYGAGTDNAIRFRIGLFTPDADSEYWDDSFAVFTGDEDDFEDTVVGFDFRYGLTSRSGLLFSADFYEGEEDQAYLDFVDAAGFDIFHTTTLDVVSLTAAYTFDFAGPRATVIPYAGIGGGMYFWELEETGDFIDFVPVDPEIFATTFNDDGETFGWFWLAGVKFNMGPRWDLFVEGRWTDADDELSGDFEGLGDLDLSGRSITGGFSWKF